jgi:hypothetical protein
VRGETDGEAGRDLTDGRTLNPGRSTSQPGSVDDPPGSDAPGGQALAREVEVSVRTIYRDVEQLSLSGVPVVSSAARPAVGWYKKPARADFLQAAAEAVWTELRIHYEGWNGVVQQDVAGGREPRTYRVSSIVDLSPAGKTFRRPKVSDGFATGGLFLLGTQERFRAKIAKDRKAHVLRFAVLRGLCANFLAYRRGRARGKRTRLWSAPGDRASGRW